MKVSMKDKNEYIKMPYHYGVLKVLLDSTISGQTMAETSTMAKQFAARNGITNSMPFVAQSMRDAYYATSAMNSVINDVDINFVKLNVPTNPLTYAAIGIYPEKKYWAGYNGHEETDGKTKLYTGCHILPNGEMFFIHFIPSYFLNGNLNMNHQDMLKDYIRSISKFIDAITMLDTVSNEKFEMFFPCSPGTVLAHTVIVPYHIYDITGDQDAFEMAISYGHQFNDQYMVLDAYKTGAKEIFDIYKAEPYIDDYYTINRLITRATLISSGMTHAVQDYISGMVRDLGIGPTEPTEVGYMSANHDETGGDNGVSEDGESSETTDGV